MKKAKKNIKLAFILSGLKPGGMERLVVNLSNALEEYSIPVLIICIQDKGELSSELKGTNIRIKSLGSYKSRDIKSLFLIGKTLREFKPSIINIHDYSSLPYAVAASRLFYRAPMIFTAHGLLYRGFKHLKPRIRLFSRFLTGITAVSTEVAKRHRLYLNWKKNIEIIPNGVPEFKKDRTAGESIRKELNIKNETFLFISIGNPRPEKGFEDLIDASILLKKKLKDNNFKVAVAGRLEKTSYCNMLESKIKENSLEKEFLLLGFRKDTKSLYSAADAFVLPSRSEGMPMVILEAMTASLPIVATDVGGVLNTVKDSALISKPQNPYELAELMEKIMDKEVSENLGKRAREIAVKGYGSSKMAENYLSFFHEQKKRL